ncbi:MAG TPA: hypothetical protein PK256_12440 [Verrucomicrobiota bacterium]|nr:hypothetical protein [Verrucomicrobiota bacterium]
MLILDENLPEDQKQLLHKWGVRFRSVGVDVETYGALDENLLVSLRRLSHPTFFSLDKHFFRADWAHSAYSLIWLDVSDNQSADYIRRFVKHPNFDTQIKRMGVVARLHSDGIVYRRLPIKAFRSVPWI